MDLNYVRVGSVIVFDIGADTRIGIVTELDFDKDTVVIVEPCGRVRGRSLSFDYNKGKLVPLSLEDAHALNAEEWLKRIR